jgi:anti-sigma B factor antagonist
MTADCLPYVPARNDDGKPAGNQAAALDVSCRTDNGHFVVTLRGVLDASVAPPLREYLLGLVQESAGRLIIDLSAVTHADVNGLTVLVGTGRRANLLGGALRLAAPAPEVVRALSTAGLERQLHVYLSVEAAISGMGSA